MKILTRITIGLSALALALTMMSASGFAAQRHKVQQPAAKPLYNFATRPLYNFVPGAPLGPPPGQSHNIFGGPSSLYFNAGYWPGGQPAGY